MTADGPSANRPPHSLLDVSMRLIIAALLTLALAGCDKGKQDHTQEQASIARIDRSLAGQEAPATPLLGPQDQPVTLAAFRGKPLIVTLWATSCALCMPEDRQSVVWGQSVSVRVD